MEVPMKKLINNFILKIKSGLSLISENQQGIGSIEMVLILLVLVGLIVVFRENIMSIIDSVFDKITTQIDSF